MSEIDMLTLAKQENARREKSESQLMDERDRAEEAMSQAYYLVVGRSPEWSNLFGYTEALEEIGDAVSVLKQAAMPTATEPATWPDAG